MYPIRSTLTRLERYCAWIMLADGALGLIVSAAAAGTANAPPWTSLLGVLAALLALRGLTAGLAGGLLFYALQVASYYSRDLQWHFGSGIGLGAVFQLPHGTLVINVAAVAGLAVIVWILTRRG